MDTEAIQSFLLPANGKATPASIARKRQLAAALLQSGMDASPVASPWQAAARVAQGLVGGLSERRANSQETEGISGANAALAAALQGNDPNALAAAAGNPFMTGAGEQLIGDQYNKPYRDAQLAMEDKRFGQVQANQDRNFNADEAYRKSQIGMEQQRLDLEKANKGGQLRPLSPDETKALSGGYIDQSGGVHLPTNRGLRPTTDQSNAAGFYDRMTESDKILADPAIAGEGMSLVEKNVARLPFGTGNYMVSDNYQKFDQATRNFVNAVLRKESGAAISEGEFENARRQYFPQPGDSKEVLSQKAQNRATAIAAMHRSAGPAMQSQSDTDQPVPLPDQDATLSSARDAISAGADPEAVKQRLIENGIDPSGL